MRPRILSLLSNGVHLSCTEMSERLGSTERIVRKVVKSLYARNHVRRHKIGHGYRWTLPEVGRITEPVEASVETLWFTDPRAGARERFVEDRKAA